MEISIITPSTLDKTDDGALRSNITDETPIYDNSGVGSSSDANGGKFPINVVRVNGFDKYTSVQEITPIIYSSDDISTYEINDIIFKDHYITKVTSIGSADVPAQPEDYTSPSPSDPNNTSFLYSHWDCYWARIQTGLTGTFDGYEIYAGNKVKHKLFRDTSSASGWSYQYSYPALETYWREESFRFYYEPYSYWDENILKDSLKIYSGGVLLYDGSLSSAPSEHNIDGNIYMRGTNQRIELSSAHHYYSVMIQSTRIGEVVNKVSDDIYVHTSVDESSEIYHAYCDTTDYDNKWTGRTFVINDGNLYVRTGNGIDTPETVSVSVPQYKILANIDEFPQGYWAKTGVVNALAPFDSTSYSYCERYGDSVMYVSADNVFDTISLVGLVAEYVTIRFLDTDNQTIYEITRSIDNRRDIDGRLPDYPTTDTFYCLGDDGETIDVPKNTIIRVYLSGAYTRLGGVKVGISTNAGFTNLEFNNEFEDWSPYEKDEQWGTVEYIDGVKTQVYSGTVDVPIKNYDMTNRLMTSIGGNTIILNGSGLKDNSVPDSDNDTFASTNIIGRLENFKLKTKLKNKRIDKVATYSFIIREQV